MAAGGGKKGHKKRGKKDWGILGKKQTGGF